MFGILSYILKNKFIPLFISISIQGLCCFCLGFSLFFKVHLAFDFYFLTSAIAKHYLGHNLRSDRTWWVENFPTSWNFYPFCHLCLSHHSNLGPSSRWPDSRALSFPALHHINIIIAVFILIHIRKFHSPQHKASKTISFASSLFSFSYKSWWWKNTKQLIVLKKLLLWISLWGVSFFSMLVMLDIYMIIKAKYIKYKKKWKLSFVFCKSDWNFQIVHLFYWHFL